MSNKLLSTEAARGGVKPPVEHFKQSKKFVSISFFEFTVDIEDAAERKRSQVLCADSFKLDAGVESIDTTSNRLRCVNGD